jgi:tryptophan synthase alpha chain
MSVIERLLRQQRTAGREGALIPYLMGGDPAPRYTYEIVEALVKGGADIVELGIPFSDPIADGPTIQAASTRALAAGATPLTVLDAIRQIRRDFTVPVVVMTYYNPVFRMGVDSFFRVASDSGVNGVIVPDLPVEEAEGYTKVAADHGVDTIFLAAPSTSEARLKRIVAASTGFLYLVSLYGVTGARESVAASTLSLINRVRTYTENVIPLCVGFGLSTAAHVRTVLTSGADGAIVGSAFVQIIERWKSELEHLVRAVETKTRDLKTGTVVGDLG